MLYEVITCLIDECTGLVDLGHFFLDEGPIISMTDEADFLALFQFIGGEPKGLRLPPHFGLLHSTHREQKLGQPCWIESIEKVALILLAIGRPIQPMFGITLRDPDIVAGGHIWNAACLGKIEQSAQLDPFVAADTRVRRRAVGITV